VRPPFRDAVGKLGLTVVVDDDGSLGYVDVIIDVDVVVVFVAIIVVSTSGVAVSAPRGATVATTAAAATTLLADRRRSRRAHAVGVAIGARSDLSRRFRRRGHNSVARDRFGHRGVPFS